MLLLFIHATDYGRNTEGGKDSVDFVSMSWLSRASQVEAEVPSACHQATKYVDKRGLPLVCELQGIPQDITT